MRSEDLYAEFPAPVRELGAIYHRGRAIKIVTASPTAIAAIARGRLAYDVRIEVAAGTLVLACSCPNFLDEGACRHLWATVLLAEERSDLAPLPAYRQVRLDKSDAGADADTDAGDGAEDLKRFTAAPMAPYFVAAREPPLARSPQAVVPASPVAAWQTLVSEARRIAGLPVPPPAPPPALIIYVVDLDKVRYQGDLVVTLRTRALKKDGGWTKDKPASVAIRALDLIPDERDRRALPLYQAAASIATSPGGYHAYNYGHGYGERMFPTEAIIPGALAGELLSLLSDGERLFMRQTRDAELRRVRYQADPPWDFVLQLRRREGGSVSEIRGFLARAGEMVEVSVPLVVTASGWVVFPDRVARLRHFGAFALLGSLRGRAVTALAPSEERAFLKTLFSLPAVPRLDLPEDLTLREIAGTAQPVLRVGPPAIPQWGAPSNRPRAELSFSYGDGDVMVALGDHRDVIADIEAGRLLRRDRAAETAALGRLHDAGFRLVTQYARADSRAPDQFEIGPARLATAVQTLVGAGWRVEAEGRLYRRPGRFQLSVSSGVDWFDLDARIDFEGVSASLPELLRALRRGDKTIVLGDGSIGMLPEQWLKRYGLLAEVATTEGDHIRFAPAQVGLLDALLAAEPEVSVDQLFEKARDQLRHFDRIDAEKAPRGFTGELRPYQEIGLGWLSFLRRFGFGGCLADDMGLGKTVQVLAMLASRRAAKKPSLVVVPKSLVWNWQQEAARFVPDLRVLAHVGPTRAADGPALRQAVAKADVVLTTYGLLRKDAVFLREIEMDYLILDEAQAIKNPASESAKAARLLRGQHRLALSGTPIENHIGELWSLVDFLNPGMLGGSRAFAGATGTRRPEPELLALLARVLRPFILRRTKEQVAPELPPKHEETILCEMEPEQRRLYDELRAHYRLKLRDKIARDGLGKAKIQVLEALLRLRQAACHPALIDKKRAGDGSGKMDVLFARLDEVRREGHKAIVFSQFTSFLALVRARLDEARVPYEYLDGKTRDRQACVTRFQSDAACPLFLVSLKAGGVGLNLTAADYVFILDPWWNPAVEAQAVDRAHRIGQDKHVFVYRLLCRDSVEEKVAALQEEKRGLAAAIIDGDGSVIQNLDRETLELLLG